MSQRPTPPELAQWAIDAHLANMDGALTDTELDNLLGHVGAEYTRMTEADLRSALQAMSGIAEEFAYELYLRDGDARHATALLRDGRRMWTVRPVPTPHDEIGIGAAKDLARELVWAHIHAHRQQDFDDASVENLYEHLEQIDDALDKRSRSQLALIDSVLREYEHGLDPTGPSLPSLALDRHEPNRNACKDAVLKRARNIGVIAERLFSETGANSTATRLHAKTFV